MMIRYQADQVWSNEARARRIIRIFGGRVYYSKGGDRTHNCLVESFHHWVRRAGAKQIHGENNGQVST